MPGFVHQRAHALHGCRQSAEDGFSDEEMADVELDDFWTARNRRHSVERQTMSGMNFETRGGAEFRGCCSDALDLGCHAARIVVQRLLAIGARMQLDDVGSELCGCLDGLWIGLDEE